MAPNLKWWMGRSLSDVAIIGFLHVTKLPHFSIIISRSTFELRGTTQ